MDSQSFNWRLSARCSGPVIPGVCQGGSTCCHSKKLLVTSPPGNALCNNALGPRFQSSPNLAKLALFDNNEDQEGPPRPICVGCFGIPLQTLNCNELYLPNRRAKATAHSVTHASKSSQCPGSKALRRAGSMNQLPATSYSSHRRTTPIPTHHLFRSARNRNRVRVGR